jgi:hypothetical protein
VINFPRAIGITVGIWVLGYACALPVGIFSRTLDYDFCGQFCDEVWPDTDPQTGVSKMRKVYGMTVLIVQFVMPTVISSFCYWRIGRLIQRQMRKRNQSQIVLQENRERLQNRNLFCHFANII